MAKLTEKQLKERLESIEAARDDKFQKELAALCKKYGRRLNPVVQLEIKRV